MDPLITRQELEARLGRTLVEPEASQADAFIADASALVRQIADDDMIDDAGNLAVPPAIVPVVVSMVRRALENPRGLSSESIGDYSYNTASSQLGTIYATRREHRIIRRAVGTLGVRALQMEGYLTAPTTEGLL